MPEPRRPPAPRDVHGSIRGSQANPLADHPLARLFDCISQQNKFDFELYGYLDHGFTWNPDSPADRTNGPVLNNYRSNAYQMNGLYLVAERKIDPNRDAIQLGGRLDQLYGTDAIFNLTTGLDENIVTDSASRFYKLAYPQAYANLFLPIGRGVSFKVGSFYTTVGNVSAYAPENFFYSLYFSDNIQPGTLTGFLGETQLTDTINIRFGPNLGWNTFDNINNSVSYAGSLTWKSRNKKSQIQFDFQNGKQRSAITVADSNVMVYSLVINQQLHEHWHYMLEHDLLVSNSRTGTIADDYESYSLSNYLFYDFNERWRAGLRFEWLRDDDGTLTGVDPTQPAAPGSYYDLTLGLNWHPRDHLRIRPEIRGDWQVRDSKTMPAAFDDGTSTNQVLLACDILWEF